MEADIRKHSALREQVHAGVAALRVQGRQIWGERRHTLPEIVLRLMVGVGDLARDARDYPSLSGAPASEHPIATGLNEHVREQLKKELGNVIFSTIRWIDDLGLDALECLDLAIEAQEKFAASGRPR